jgi:hypothetical protein
MFVAAADHAEQRRRSDDPAELEHGARLQRP